MPSRSLSQSPSMSRFRFRLVFVLAFVFGSMAGSGPASAAEGVLKGQLFTAQHPDSLAGGAEVTLVFRDDTNELTHKSTVATPRGEYEFTGLKTDPGYQYVVRVAYFDRDFLGPPISFEDGQTEVEFNFLVARNAAPLPPMEGEAHSHPTSTRPPMGSPVPPNPGAMVAITATILALFLLPILSAYRRDRLSVATAGSPARPRAVDALMRDIAALDLRFSEREIEEGDYRSVRRSLLQKLHALTGAERTESSEIPRT